MESALSHVGYKAPSLPQSGVGKDPRKKYEDEHWTNEQKEGYAAYAESVKNKPEKIGVQSNGGRVGNRPAVWNNQRGKECPPSGPSLRSAERRSSVSLANRVNAYREAAQGTSDHKSPNMPQRRRGLVSITDRIQDAGISSELKCSEGMTESGKSAVSLVSRAKATQAPSNLEFSNTKSAADQDEHKERQKSPRDRTSVISERPKSSVSLHDRIKADQEATDVRGSPKSESRKNKYSKVGRSEGPPFQNADEDGKTRSPRLRYLTKGRARPLQAKPAFGGSEE